MVDIKPVTTIITLNVNYLNKLKSRDKIGLKIKSQLYAVYMKCTLNSEGANKIKIKG